MSLYIDLSEFLANPITTGIQRVVGEICRCLPRGAAVPVRLRSGRYVPLAPALITAIGSYFRDVSEAAASEIRRLGSLESDSIRVSQGDTILVPEVFLNPERLSFFRQMPEEEWRRVRFIVHDLLPLTHPEYFSEDLVFSIYGYYQLVREAVGCAFVSEDTREAYYSRLKRTDARGGVVLPLGCDALGPRVDRPAVNRPLTFTVLGTIEPRKNHQLILDALEPLLREDEAMSVAFIGKMGWADAELARRVETLASRRNSRFLFCPDLNDRVVRSYIEQSRATIYVSSAEGYGLPPMESLWLGTPVIASTTIPSLKAIGSMGVHYVDPLTPVNLVQAVLAFVNDDYANDKTEETSHLKLPTWDSFTQEVLRWCARE